MKKNKIWVISEYFYPNISSSTGYFMTSIAEKLAENNSVSAITATKNQSNRNSSEVYKNIEIIRVKDINLSKNNLIQRFFKLVIMTFRMSFEILFRVKSGDKIFCVTNPAFIILLIPFLKKLKGNIHSTILVYDVLPENFHAAKILSDKSIIYKTIKFFFNKSYASFDNIITIGRDMEKVFQTKLPINYHQNIKIITNWAETDLVKPYPKYDNKIIKSLKLENKIIIQFAGNIGRLQGLEKLVSIFAKCDSNRFHFLFIGDGAVLPELKSFVLKNEVKNITFLGSLPRSEQNVFLNACDIGLVTLNQNMFGLGVPSKSYNILSCEKPIFFIGDLESEIALMIKENKIGWAIENNDAFKIPTILNNIFENKELLKKMSLKCRQIAIKEYSKDVILNKYKKLLSFSN